MTLDETTLAKGIAEVVEKSSTKEEVVENLLKFLSREYYLLHIDMDFEVNFGHDLLGDDLLHQVKVEIDKN
ncbi:MAG: hypothetical protein ABS939_08340 [Psychrobacillus sp.]